MDQSVVEDKTNIQQKRQSQFKLFWQRFLNNKTALVGGAIVLICTIAAILAPLIAPYDPFEIDLTNKLAKPSVDHLMGTDDKGRDIFSRVLYGTRISLTVGVVSVLIGATVGITLGLISGFYGGIIDTIIMRVVDVLLAFPGILLALAIISALGPDLINVMIAVGIFTIPTFARIVRGSTLDLKNIEYIEAARTLGASDFRII